MLATVLTLTNLGGVLVLAAYLLFLYAVITDTTEEER